MLRLNNIIFIFLLFMATSARATDYYVSSVAGNNTTGTTWATAKTTIAAGLALATASGDRVYVDSAHTETYGSATNWDAPTADTSISLISVNRNGSTTTGHSGWLAGAAISSTTSGASFAIGATRAQAIYIYGVSITPNNGNNSSNSISLASGNFNALVVCHTCTFNTPMQSSGAGVLTGGAGSSSWLNRKVILVNTSFVLKNSTAGASIQFGCNTEIINPTLTFSGANKSATLFGTTTGIFPLVSIIDSDLSGYDKSGGFYFNSSLRGTYYVRKVKLSGTPGLMDATAWADNNSSITLIDVDSGDTHNVFEYRNRFGTITENTSIYASGGSLHDSVPISWQVVTTSAVNEGAPFITPWFHRWGASTSAQTWTIEFDHDSTTALNNRDIWAEFEYASNASFPQGTLLNVRNSQPFDGTGVNWATGAATWTQSFTNNNPQTITSGSVTPAEKSLLRARVSVSVASKTLYLDPQLRISTAGTSAPTTWTDTGAYNEAPQTSTSGGSYTFVQ